MMKIVLNFVVDFYKIYTVYVLSNSSATYVGYALICLVKIWKSGG